MRFKPTGIRAISYGSGIILTIGGIPTSCGEDVDRLTSQYKHGNEYELRQVRKKRSLDSNGYFWTLCDEIAKAVNTTKEQVYWKFIKRVGVFDTLQFTTEEAMNRFKANWRQNGLGWLTYTVDKEKCVLQAYYESSRYNTKEMSRLIDEAIDEAKGLGIETLTPEELARMKDDWRNGDGEN